MKKEKTEAEEKREEEAAKFRKAVAEEKKALKKKVKEAEDDMLSRSGSLFELPEGETGEVEDIEGRPIDITVSEDGKHFSFDWPIDFFSTAWQNDEEFDKFYDEITNGEYDYITLEFSSLEDAVLCRQAMVWTLFNKGHIFNPEAYDGIRGKVIGDVLDAMGVDSHYFDCC